MDYKKNYINGEWRLPQSNEIIEVISPIDKKLLARVPSSNLQDVNYAVEAAKNALPAWSEVSVDERIELMENLLEILEAKEEEMASVIVAELGTTHQKALNGQLRAYFQDMRYFINFSRDFDFQRDFEGYRVLKEPVGVVAALTPWNYPFGQITRKITPALLMGNTIVLKPSQITPLVAYHLTDAIDKAGFPKGVFNLIVGKGSEVGEYLSKHEDVNCISFTGSTTAGIRVYKNAVESMKRVTLELGGKSPCLILEGGDLEKALDTVLPTIYNNCGQTCSALSRIVAPRKYKKELEELIVEKTKEFKFGNPYEEGVDVGSLASKKQEDKVREYIEIGKKEGARVLYQESLDLPEGHYMGPVIFTDVRPQMRIAQEEIFGPVLVILYYDDIEEALNIANGVIFGLSSAIFGPEEEALQLAKKIKAGTVIVNGQARSFEAPFGGYKYSGVGREGGAYGLDEFIELKTVFI